MDLELFKKRLKNFCGEIIFSKHARIRMDQRQICEEEVIFNLNNPEKLRFVVEQKADYAYEEKFDCYFVYTKKLCHRYILLFSEGILILTVLKLNKRWQKLFEKNIKGKKGIYGGKNGKKV